MYKVTTARLHAEIALSFSYLRRECEIMTKKQNKVFGKPAKQAEHEAKLKQLDQVNQDKKIVMKILDEWASFCKNKPECSEHYIAFTVISSTLRAGIKAIGAYEAMIPYCENVSKGLIKETLKVTKEAALLIEPLKRLKIYQYNLPESTTRS